MSGSGISGGDIIVKLDDTPIQSLPETCNILNSSGDSLKVETIPGNWFRSPETDLGAVLARRRTVTKPVTLE